MALDPNLLENVGLCTENDIPSIRPPHVHIAPLQRNGRGRPYRTARYLAGGGAATVMP